MRSRRNWSPRMRPPTSAAPTPEEDEEGREAEDERHASPDHTPSVPGLAELVCVDRRHGREVGGHERQDARREKRDHPGEERDRDRRPAHALNRRIERAPRPRGARAPGRAAPPSAQDPLRGGSTRGSGARPRRRHPGARRVATATREARIHRPAAPRRTPGPNSATSASLISCSESPAAMRTRMNVFMRTATGAFDWSSVVSHTGQTSSASRSAAFGGAADTAPASTAPSTAASARARLTSRAPDRWPRAASGERRRRLQRPRTLRPHVPRGRARTSRESR